MGCELRKLRHISYVIMKLYLRNLKCTYSTPEQFASYSNLHKAANKDFKSIKIYATQLDQKEEVLFSQAQIINRFENRKVPLAPGKSLNDWIRLTNSGGVDLAGTNGKILKVTEDDMQAHSDASNVWIILNGRVYNVAPYLEYHPGGADEIMRAAGTDATDLFNEIHPWVAWDSMLKNSFVGHFVGRRERLRTPDKRLADIGTLSVTDGPTPSKPAALQYRQCRIGRIEKVTHDTNFYVLESPSSSDEWPKNLPLGCHVFFKLSIENVDVVRPYTIVDSNLFPHSDTNATTKSSKLLCFVIKLYANGLFTKQMKSLKKGDIINVSDVVSPFSATLLDVSIESLLLFAAGTGVTPFFRLISAFISTKNIRLYFFNKTTSDIICKEHFAKLMDNHPKTFTLEHILSAPDKNWNGTKGRISEEMMSRFMKGVHIPKSFTCVCGPAGFNDECLRLLLQLGWPREKIFMFSG